MRKFLTGTWTTIAFLLIVAAVAYAISEIYLDRSWASGGKLLAVLFLILVLFVVEGVEIAAVTLQDKDLEQIQNPSLREIVGRLHRMNEAFVTGRQAVEVSLVVLIVLLSESLFRVDRGGLPLPWVDSPTSEKLAYGLAIGLSSLVVCWFSQLLAKLYAEERPLQMLHWAPARWVIYWAIEVDKSQFGAPSFLAWNWLKRKGSNEEELLPSRDKHYRYSAQLRYSRGLDYTKTTIVIGEKGNVTVTVRSKFESFGPSFKGTPEVHRWEASVIRDSCKFNLLNTPKGCGYYAGDTQPEIDDADMTPRFGNLKPDSRSKDTTVIKNGLVAWNIVMQDDIPKGEILEYEVSFSTEADGCKSKIGEPDYYGYYVHQPTRVAEFEIKPSPDAPFLLTDRDWTVNISEDASLNIRERERMFCEPKDRGFRFWIYYPHEGSDILLTWRVGPRAVRTGSIGLPVPQPGTK